MIEWALLEGAGCSSQEQARGQRGGGCEKLLDRRAAGSWEIIWENGLALG